MTTVKEKQNALRIKDRWSRGVNYTRYLTLTDASGTPIDLTAYPYLEIAVQGPNNSDPLVPVVSAVYDDSPGAGGAAGGAITVTINKATLETGWPESGAAPTNQIFWTLKASATAQDPEERPIFNARVTVYDTAFI